ncbi:MAG TPA: class I SAM-dependent methyltransferase [bacterium]|nr:class I SAM-dependent methyltransferase [bacterium]HPG47374.1 class I SAM-dependent methyltransferase [bacterium]HPM99726.1 class I SAM-dependent methyltransferase [bacterium]
MNDPNQTCRLYSDLAWLWPMWGDPADQYARYCEHVVQLIERYSRRPVKTLLDLTCGGGKNIFNLKSRYQVTGLDLSPDMLKIAKQLNPTCDFIQGDIRTFSLGKTFDAVLMDDGISYMTTRADLSAALQNAFNHLNPGGVLILTLDATKESFQQNQTTATPASGPAKPEHVDVVFVENNYDPDPEDECCEATMLFLIREHGVLRIEQDRHLLGLFPLKVWLQILNEVGFTLNCDPYSEDGTEYTTFSCFKSLNHPTHSPCAHPADPKTRANESAGL